MSSYEEFVRIFPFATRTVCRTGVSDDDVWQAAKAGDCRPCRPVLPTHSKSDCAAWEFLTGKTDRKGEKERVQRVLRDTNTWLVLFLELTLTVQMCCLELVLNTRAQACSEAF